MEEDKDLIKRQVAFVDWLKERGMYSEMASAHVMQKMQRVWEESNKQLAEANDLLVEFEARSPNIELNHDSGGVWTLPDRIADYLKRYKIS